MNEVWIPIMLFAMIAAIVIVPTWLKSKERQDLQTTVRAAIDKGQPLPVEVIEAMSKDVTKSLPSRTRDIRQGIIWLAVGFGIAAFALITDFAVMNGDGPFADDSPVGGVLLGIAAIPATIGLAFLLLSFFNKNKD